MRTKLQSSKKLSLLNVEHKLIMEIKSCPQYQAILRDLKINITTNKAAKQDGVTTSKRKNEPNSFSSSSSANKSSKDYNTTSSRKRNLDNSFIDEVSDSSTQCSAKSDSSVGRALCTSNRSIMLEDVYEDSTSTDISNVPVQEVYSNYNNINSSSCNSTLLFLKRLARLIHVLLHHHFLSLLILLSYVKSYQKQFHPAVLVPIAGLIC